MGLNVGNLPPWPGAEVCYRRAYRLLERMAANGHVTLGFDMGHPRGRGLDRRPLPLNGCCCPSRAMRDLIDALARGDEASIKRALLDDRGDVRAPTAAEQDRHGVAGVRP
ncbi:MAG TPA: hypothetical protein VGX76_12185 [Pirellulales bacterium]|jgi:hypothetical protein|nr:hypothetical protein [Pirellulales bacterium]